ncbi:HLH-domain-containing protein [Coprinopsis marcescibilis]|uniref:HLH-domain-containing protein n=1 Tax=Coprinopsis marcescibilis TaxID=230819 RepID=A0A5C3KNW1_COPMA|nr:HLH-domain-containing protein [Coprinopsis marcescibilis]
MSFFSAAPATTYKAQVRVEGFHLPSPGTPPGGTSGSNNAGGSNGNGSGNNMNDLFPQSFLPDAFRKFPPPAGSGEGSHDFNDDLVSLMGDRTSGPTQSGAGGGGGTGAGAGGGGGNGGAYDDGYHRTHNIFDVSSPIPVNTNPNGVPNGGNNGTGSQPSSLHSPSTSLHDYHNHPPPHFNSTLPALNSSMRYEPPPENNPLTPSSPQLGGNPPPSSYHNPHNGFARQTPSPSHTQPGSVPANGRPRSHSRPPSSTNATGSNPSAALSALNSGGVGPARTTRTRRGNSISGTSPPPLHGRPHAILIPGGGQRGAHGGIVGSPMSAGANPSNGNPWFMSQGQNQNSADYLPTPESLGSHQSVHSSLPSHHHSHSHSGYGPFSLSPPPQSSTGPNSDLSHHLPPLHHMAHSLPKSPLEQHLPHPHHHQHHLSGSGLPKSPLDHSYQSSYGFGSGNVNGSGSNGSPSGASPGSLPSVLGGGLGSSNGPNGMTALAAGGVPAAGSSYGMGNMGMGLSVGSAPGSGAQQSAIAAPAAPTPHVADKQALLANEKRRRRRESHNAVERRRRDNINEKISELATLIPECLLDGTGPPNAKDNGASITPPLTEDALVPKGPQDPALKLEKDDDGVPVNGVDGAAVVKANKGMILRKSVEYIRYLQQLVTAQGARNRELEQELRKFRGEPLSSESPDVDGGIGRNDSLEQMRKALSSLDDDEGSLEGDDSMSLGLGGGNDGEMVLHDEFLASPTLSSVGSGGGNSSANNGTAPIKGGVARKGHHKHSSSSSRPKPPRLPSMPEEDMEVDKGGEGNVNVNGTGSLSPESSGTHESANSNGQAGGEDDFERGRARGVRTGMGGPNFKEELMEDGGVDHSMGEIDSMFGMMNGHGHHQLHNHHQQHQQVGMW